MSFKTAFTTAWKDLKKAVTSVDTFLIADGPKIQSAIQVGVGVEEGLLPASAPIVTALDTLEESVMGELLTVANAGSAVVNSTTGEAAVTLSAPLYASIKQIAATLSTTKTVVEAATKTPLAA